MKGTCTRKPDDTFMLLYSSQNCEVPLQKCHTYIADPCMSLPLDMMLRFLYKQAKHTGKGETRQENSPCKSCQAGCTQRYAQ